MQHPFAAKWTIAEDELITMKKSVNGCLTSSYITTTSGIQYCFSLYPNGNRASNRGKVFISLVLKLGGVKEVEAKCTVKVESADNYSQEIHSVFKKSRSAGVQYCSTKELFDTQKGFINDGEMELKVDGYFVFVNDKKTNHSFPSKLGKELWANDESKDYEIIVGRIGIKVHKVILATMSPVFDKMFKSKTKEARQNQLTISGFSFHIVQKALKAIYGASNIYKDDDCKHLIQFFDKFNIPSLEDSYMNCLLNIDEQNPPIADGMVEVFHDLVSNANKRINQSTEIGKKLWENHESKDFKIVVDGKVLMVHKLILAARSPTFAAMFRTKPNTNQITIDDFSFDIVKRALNVIYAHNMQSAVELDYLSPFLKFFYKYDFPSIKDSIESILTCHINASTVCRLTNLAINTSSTQLQVKCMEFIVTAMETKTALYNIGILEKLIALKVVQYCGHRVMDKNEALKLLEESFYQIVHTQ